MSVHIFRLARISALASILGLCLAFARAATDPQAVAPAASAAPAASPSASAGAQAKVSPPAPEPPDKTAATWIGAGNLLKNDADFFEEVVFRLPANDYKAIFGSDRREIPAQPSSDDLKKASADTRALQAKLKSLSVTAFDRLVAAAEPLYAGRVKECAKKVPAIHTIGWSPTFTFESAQTPRPPKAGERAVRIPVEGYDLDPPCIAIGVTIEGTVPVSRYGASIAKSDNSDNRDFHVNLPSEEHKDGLNIVLLQPFIDRLHTGDKVAIKVTAANKYALPENAEPAKSPPLHPGSNFSENLDVVKPPEFRRLSIARRVFIAYEAEAYRAQVLRSRISPDDINAFPLPDNDVRTLFGPSIASSYFVVRVSVRNTESDAKIISTGMIRASGTAMIAPKVDSSPSFSVPVSVVPHSLTQIYAALTDEEVDQRRNQLFRGLEFVGALAAGAQGVFNYGAQAAKNVALFTGIVIPETKKLWPDRYPGYQRNIVNFAMQDLVKVPANSVMDHKFLFFSKKELDGLVSDPNLFKTLSGTEKFLGSVTNDDARINSKPDAFVIALAFDTLDIRFESMPVTLDLSPRDVLRDLVVPVADQIRDLSLNSAWTTTTLTTGKFGAYTQAESASLITGLTAIGARADPTPPDPDLTAAKLNAAQLLTLANGIKPVDPTVALAIDLYAPAAKYGQASLAKAQTRIGELVQRVNSGADAENAKDEIIGLKSVVTSSRDLLTFYTAVAGVLHEQALVIDKAKAAAAVSPLTVDAKSKLQAFNAGAQAALSDLESKRPVQATLQVKPAQ